MTFLWPRLAGDGKRGLPHAITAVATILASTAFLVACSSSSTDSTNAQATVQALWFSGSGDTVEEGTASVTISFVEDPHGQEFTLDLDTEKAQGAGPAWTAATWSAASVSTLFSFRDPRTLSFSVSIDGAIDGPSAGGLMATAMLSKIAGLSLKSDTTMTGTINPDGSIGMVGGIPAKIRAAAKAGLSHVLIPAGAKNSVDPQTDEVVNVVEEGKKLGVKVTEVSSLSESVAYMTGLDRDLEPDNSPVASISKPVLKSVGKSALELDTLTKRRIAEAKKVGVAGRVIQTAEVARSHGAKMLAKGGVVDSYAQFWQTYYDLSGAVAAQRIRTTVRQQGIDVARQQLLSRIDDLEQVNESKQTKVAQTRTKNAQQGTGLPDALTWSTDSAVSLDVYRSRLQASSTAPQQLPALASAIAQDAIDIDTSLSQTVSALMASGSGSANEQDISQVLAAYTNFFKQTGDANMNYFEQVLTHLNNDQDRDDLAQRSFRYAMANQLRQRMANSQNLSESTVQEQRLLMAQALSYYIESSQLVVGVEILQVEESDQMGGTLDIVAKSGFANAVDSSTYVNKSLLQILTEEDVDSSYAHWGVQWGRWQATRPKSLYGDSQRIMGLTNMWHASTQLLLLNSQPIEAINSSS